MKISKKDKAKNDAIELRQEALYGRPYGSADMFISEMLIKFHAGHYPKTKSSRVIKLNDNEAYAVTLPGALSHQIIEAIILNEPQFIHELANAVTRIHGDGKRRKGRTHGHGPTFRIQPSDPALLHAVETMLGSTVRCSKAEFQKSLASKGIPTGKKKAQRILRKLNIPADKGGRPRKVNLPVN